MLVLKLTNHKGESTSFAISSKCDPLQLLEEVTAADICEETSLISVNEAYPTCGTVGGLRTTCECYYKFIR